MQFILAPPWPNESLPVLIGFLKQYQNLPVNCNSGFNKLVHASLLNSVILNGIFQPSGLVAGLNNMGVTGIPTKIYMRAINKGLEFLAII